MEDADKIKVVRKGLLTKYGYKISDTAANRHKSLEKAANEYGAGNLVLKLNAICVLTKSRSPSQSVKYCADKRWVEREYNTKTLKKPQNYRSVTYSPSRKISVKNRASSPPKRTMSLPRKVTKVKSPPKKMPQPKKVNVPNKKRSTNKPANPKLYEQVKKEIIAKNPVHSAYRSGAIVKEYKKRGGTYTGTKPKKSGLTRWFEEDWKNQSGKYGYQKKDDIYRPTVRVTSQTPITMSELTDKEKKRAMYEKKKKGRVVSFSEIKKKY